VIDHRGRADDPGIGLPLRIPALLGAQHAGLLLRLADKQHAFLAVEPRAVLLRDIVLALMLLERDEIHLLGLDELLDRRDKPLAQGGHDMRGGHDRAELILDEVHEPPACLGGKIGI